MGKGAAGPSILPARRALGTNGIWCCSDRKASLALSLLAKESAGHQLNGSSRTPRSWPELSSMESASANATPHPPLPHNLRFAEQAATAYPAPPAPRQCRQTPAPCDPPRTGWRRKPPPRADGYCGIGKPSMARACSARTAAGPCEIIVDHAGVVRPRRHLAENHILAVHEQLDAENLPRPPRPAVILPAMSWALRSSRRRHRACGCQGLAVVAVEICKWPGSGSQKLVPPRRDAR